MADIILKNAKGTPQLYSGVTKINVPTSDGGIATYSEGGGGIEEVTELPQATAENVGKIYKYQGQLYECKEICDLVKKDETFILTDPISKMLYNMVVNYHVVDSIPNAEDTVASDLVNGMLELYLATDGSGIYGLLPNDNGDLSVQDFNSMTGLTLGTGEYSSYNVPLDDKAYIVHFYDNVPIYDSTKHYNRYVVNKLILPKSVYIIWGTLTVINHLICNGDIYGFQAQVTKTLDISKTTVVPFTVNLSFGDTLTEIKVPSALLEQFKTATNWSAYADKMVGV